MKSIVIVGGGQAGFQAAASLRQEGYSEQIALINNEPHPRPYQRPPLSKAYLKGTVGRDELDFRPASFFEDNGIALIQDEVLSVHRSSRQIRLRNTSALNYDHLILATGARNYSLSVPGVELQGVLHLRTLEDAGQLSERLKDAKNVVVVGAGFIGLEFAAVARQFDTAVHVVERSDKPMSRAVSKETAHFFSEMHRGLGVTFSFQESVLRFDGENGNVTRAVLAGGSSRPADLVVVGIGVKPNVELAIEAGLEVENGIRVDESLLTSDPAISAIGDCAAFPAFNAEGHLRLESVQNACDQAKAVATRLIRGDHAFDAVPWFWSDQGPVKLQIAGLSTGHDDTVVLGDCAGMAFSVLLFRNGRLIAVESINKPGDFMAARKMLARNPALTPELAREAGFDLRSWEVKTRS